jgi:hypothetical protein
MKVPESTKYQYKDSRNACAYFFRIKTGVTHLSARCEGFISKIFCKVIVSANSLLTKLDHSLEILQYRLGLSLILFQLEYVLPQQKRQRVSILKCMKSENEYEF